MKKISQLCLGDLFKMNGINYTLVHINTSNYDPRFEYAYCIKGSDGTLCGIDNIFVD